MALKFLQDITEETTNFIGNAVTGLGKSANSFTDYDSATKLPESGFILPPTIPADGTGLPTIKNTGRYTGKVRRNIIHWLVPEFGVIKMYNNPSQIVYNNSKIIKKQQTKGGFTLQYWGNELSTMRISGTTGSSGVEGINLLYEIYMAEQYVMDGVGVDISGKNAAAQDLVNSGLNSIANATGLSALAGNNDTISSIAGLASGLLNNGLDQSNIIPVAIPSIAQYAFTVEMYYDGKVYRGYFDNMNITESANDYLWNYDINFVVTQERGYRTNYFPWHKNPKAAPTRYNPLTSESDYGLDYSFNRGVKL
ncbi:MAG: hypothetical protein LC122_13180 [Chitinophagales bacterium]|nr:hypothetical protein [Chitinophagales bacterium]